MIGIDLRHAEPRSAHELLGGVKLLARVIDKGRAHIAGTCGPYAFYDCPLDRILFDALEVTREDFIAVLRAAYSSNLNRNTIALFDLRESLQNEPEISDETFLEHAAASDIDDAAVRWIYDRLQTPAAVIALVNASVDRLPPAAFNDRS